MHVRRPIFVCLTIALCWASARSQTKPAPPAPPPSNQKELNVNWLYGAYVPKDVALKPLTGHQRLQLYVLQTFTTPGIYLKTGFFALSDQVTNSPSEWGHGLGGFGRRLASREGQFVIQNSFSAVGNALLRYEPRYDLCRCSGFWPRTRHAFVRNFVTYGKTEEELRPQFALYGAALGAGMTASLWKPGGKAWIAGYQSVFTQAGFGILTNWIGEFSSEIAHVLHKKPKDKK